MADGGETERNAEPLVERVATTGAGRALTLLARRPSGKARQLTPRQVRTRPAASDAVSGRVYANESPFAEARGGVSARDCRP